MMIQPNILIGQWSAAAYNDYGVMEDEQIVFLPDQTGWYVFSRGYVCERETFRWTLDAQGGLALIGETYAALGDRPGTFEARQSTLRIERLGVSVREEPSPRSSGRALQVLAFESAPFAGGLRFALLTADNTSIVFPHFEGEPDIG